MKGRKQNLRYLKTTYGSGYQYLFQKRKFFGTQLIFTISFLGQAPTALEMMERLY